MLRVRVPLCPCGETKMHYIVTGKPLSSPDWGKLKTDGPIQATSPEEAVDKASTSMMGDITVYPISTDAGGNPAEYKKEDLDL